MTRALARRLVLPFAAAAAAVALLGLLGALVSDAGVGRSVSLAFYLAGVVTFLLGLLAGLHGPLRRERGEVGRGAGVRAAQGDEIRETRAIALLLLVAGLALLVIGLAVDPRVQVV